MMNLKHKTIIASALAALLLTVALAAGCQGATAPQGSAAATKAVSAPASPAPVGQSSATTGLTVSGQGKTTMEPDVAVITLGVQTQDADAGKARSANDAAMAKVLDAVKGFGVSKDDVTTTNYSIYPTYDDKGQSVVGYRVDNDVSVRVKDLAKLGDILTSASTAGANTAYNINFTVSDSSAAYSDALSKAMDDAAARAKTMAQALGVKLGRVLSVTESSSSPGPVIQFPSFAADSKAGAVPTSGGTVDIQASVTVVYEIIK